MCQNRYVESFSKSEIVSITNDPKNSEMKHDLGNN